MLRSYDITNHLKPYWVSGGIVFCIMEFSELVQIVKQAICICESKIQENPNMVLSEADLEKLLSVEISKLIDCDSNTERFAAHNQISHYPEERPGIDYRVDIVMMKNKKIKISNKHHKRFEYDDDSIAIELKYFKERPKANEIKQDLKKSDSLLKERSNSAFFSVVLLEDNAYRDIVEGCFDNYRNNPLIHTFVITKQSTNQNR